MATSKESVGVAELGAKSVLDVSGVADGNDTSLRS